MHSFTLSLYFLDLHIRYTWICMNWVWIRQHISVWTQPKFMSHSTLRKTYESYFELQSYLKFDFTLHEPEFDFSISAQIQSEPSGAIWVDLKHFRWCTTYFTLSTSSSISFCVWCTVIFNRCLHSIVQHVPTVESTLNIITFTGENLLQNCHIISFSTVYLINW